jgi:hypothetical protein
MSGVRRLATAVVTAAAALCGSLVVVPASAAGASLRVDTLGHSGAKGEAEASAIDLSSGKTYAVHGGQDNTLPAGRYAVGAYIAEDPWMTVAVRVVQVSGPTTVVFDTGKANKVAFAVSDSDIRPVALAVVPFVTVGHQDHSFISHMGVKWPADQTYVLADASAKGVRLGVHGVLTRGGDLDHSPVRYDLVKSFQGMPNDVTVKADPKSLARVELDVATMDKTQNAFLNLTAANPDKTPVVGEPVGVGVLGHQTDYRTPGLQWATNLTMNSLDASEFLTENAKEHNLLYAAGKTYRETWGYGVWSPRPASPAIYLQDSTLRVGGGPPICAWAGTGVKLDDCQVQTQEFSYQLYKDGKLLGQGPSVSTTVDPTQPHWYAAELTASRSGGVNLSTKVTARWYFQVGGTKRTQQSPTLIVITHNQVQPGMFRISPSGLDSRNQVAHTGPTKIALSVAEFGDVASMSLDWSDDGGKTWHNVPVTGTGANRTAQLPAAGKPGTISLRAAAKSANGASVQETVTDAYGVR